MSLEQNKAVARRHFEDVWNKCDMNAADAIYAPDYVQYSYGPTDQEIRGREDIKKYVAKGCSTNQAYRYTIQDMIAEGDKVVTRWSLAMKHTDTIMGIAPTGKELTMTGIDIARIVAGRIVENWHAVNVLDLLYEVGALPKEG